MSFSSRALTPACGSSLFAAGRSLIESPSAPRSGADASVTGGGRLASEGLALTDGQGKVDALEADIQAAEARLRNDLAPMLVKGNEEVAKLASAAEHLKGLLAELSSAREDASERVRSLTKRQLAEIKQLAKSPPEPIRRTLAACWLLLNCQRFQGRASDTVRFDATKDWQRCQRMLADDAFASRVAALTPKVLADAPMVPEHVAEVYLGISFSANAAAQASAPESHTLRRHPSSPSSPSLSTVRTAAVSAAGTAVLQSKGRPSGAAALSPAPLTLEVVTRACEPCGALLRWERELVLEFAERARLVAELASVDRDLGLASERRAGAEREVSAAEDGLARLREAFAASSSALARLRSEHAAAEAAARDLDRLDALGKRSHRQSSSSHGPSSAPKAPTAVVAAPPSPKGRSGEAVLKVEAEVQGTLAVVEQTLARLVVPFAAAQTNVLDGDVAQATVLPKLASAIRENRGRLKLFLEGHRTTDEAQGSDLERSLAVYEWLVTVAGCTPGMLRVKGCADRAGLGCCVVPVPIHEVVVKSQAHRQVSGCAQISGLCFADGSAELSAEARPVLSAIAELMLEDELSVRLEGHSSNDEPDKVAASRAAAVRDALASLGVWRTSLKTESCKSLYPVSRLNLAANRRVEVHIA